MKWWDNARDTAIRDAMNQQAQIGDLLSDLNGFEEKIFRSHISFDLNRPSSSNELQDVRADLDEYAERVKEKLEAVDKLCRDGAETLTPEQFVALKEARARLERNYDGIVKTVENLQTRLNAIAALVIDFSSKSSEMHSWITDSVRKAGDIRANSADPHRLPEERRRAKALMDDIGTKEAELKALNALFVRIEAEIDQMYMDTPAARDVAGSIQAEDLRKTLMRVETDYTDLYRQAADLSTFQNRIGALGEDMDESTRRTNDWLSKLERSLDENDGASIEDRLKRAEELKEKVASDGYLLEEGDAASRRLLEALEGTAAHDDAKERYERALAQQRKRHEDVLDRVQARVNDTLAEKAQADGVKKAVADLSTWSKSFEDKVNDATRRKLALRQQSIDQMKSDEQRMRSEMEAHLALCDTLENDAKQTGIPELGAQLDNSRKTLRRSNSALTGWRDNLSDASAGLIDLATGVEAAERLADSIGSALKTTQPKDAEKLKGVEADIEVLHTHHQKVADIAKKLLGLPEVSEEEGVKNTIANMAARINGLSGDLDHKRRQADEMNEIEGKMEETRNTALAALCSLEDRLNGAAPVALSMNGLARQRSEVGELTKELEGIAPLIEEMEEISEKLFDGSGSSSLRANGPNAAAKRLALETSGKYQNMAEALKARGDRINDNESQLAAYERSADDLLRWIGRQNEKIQTECGIPESPEDATAISRKIDRLDKEIRGERRQLEDVLRQGGEMRRANVDAEGTDVIGEKARALEDEYSKLNDDIDGARARIRMAESLHERAAAFSKWMAGQRRHIDAIGGPSADPTVVKGQRRQLEMIKEGIEEEQPQWKKLIDMATDLVRDAPEGSNYKRIVDKTDELNKDWKKLQDDVDAKLKRADTVAAATGTIHGSLKDLKKSMGEIEAEVARVAKMPTNEDDKRLENLDELLNRTTGLDDSLLSLDQSIKELSFVDGDEEEVECGDITEALESYRNRADELAKRVESMKAAALSARGKEEELEKQLDELFDVSRGSKAALAASGQPVADLARVTDESKRMNDIVEELLHKDGQVAMLKLRAEELLSTRPDDKKMKEKCALLAIEWTPLVEEARQRKATFNQLADLLKQYDDQQSALETKMKEEEAEMNRVLDLLAKDKKNAEALERLAELEASAERREAECAALDKLTDRIESIAPGADARRLKRKSEQMGEDARGRMKKTKAAIAGLGRKNDLSARFNQLMDEASDLAAAYDKDVTENGDKMTRPRVQSTQHEIDAYWKRAEREIKGAAIELKEVSPEASSDIDDSVDRVASAFNDVLAKLASIDSSLEAKNEAAKKVKQRALSVGALAAQLCEEQADTSDDIGRSLEDLERNKAECDEQEKKLDEMQAEIDKAVAELDHALADGIITPSQYETAKGGLDDKRRGLEKAKKRLGQRRAKIDHVVGQIEDIKNNADNIRDALLAICAAPVLSPDQAKGDPSTQASALKEIKNDLRPLSDKVYALMADCQALIRSAPAEVTTKDLDTILRDTVAAHDEVSSKVAERERAIDAAAQQLGKYEDSYKNLLNWLEDLEEIMENQQAPSRDAKVARAQIPAYDLLLKQIEDKQPSVDGFSSLIGKLCDLTSSEEEKAALAAKDDQITNRYGDLLARAQESKAKLRDTVDLADRYTALQVPLAAWLASTEKAMNGLGQIPIDAERLERQRNEQKRLKEELTEKERDIKALNETGSMLAALVTVKDAHEINEQLEKDTRKYDELANRCYACGDSIEQVAMHLDQFLQEFAELETWLTDMEVNMLSLDDLAIDDQDELAEQANLLSELGVDVTEHEGRFADVITVGLELCKQTSRDEAMALQHRIDALKMRISDLSGVTDEKLELMERAIPLAERFHNGFEAAMEWIEAVEEDLRQLDEVPLEAQLQIVANIEEDLQLWRPDIDQVVAMSSQLQAMTSHERATDLHANTADMNRRAGAIGDQITRRSERLMMAERQSRGVLDDLDFVSEWLEEAKERVSAAAPPSIVPDYVKTQLKNQRLLNEDVATQRSRLRDTTAEARKIARQVGSESGLHDAALLSKAEAAKDLSDEVAEICEKRAERLEEGLALTQQIESAQDDIVDWIETMEREIETAPSVMTGTPMAALSAQQKHNMELAAAISAQRPLLDRFEKDLTALQALCHPEDADHLEEIKQDIAARVHDIKQNVQDRGAALEQVMDVSSALGERIDAAIAAMAAEAQRLRLDEPLTADVGTLESRVADARSLRDGLKHKEIAMDTLRERVHDHIGGAAAGDSNAKEIADKMAQCDKLWSELNKGADLKEQLLTDALGKAKRFWNELGVCERAVGDLKKRLEALEPVVGQPEILREQTNELDSIAGDVDCMPPMVEELRVAGRALSSIVPNDEKAAITSRIDNVEADTATITALCASRYGDLGRALEEAMQFHDDLGALNDYITAAEEAFSHLPPLEQLQDPQAIAEQLEIVQAIRADLDNGSLLREQLQMRANEIAEGAPGNQVAAIRHPVAELSARWQRLNNGLAEREHAINKNLLEKGQLQETAAQLLLWIEKTQVTVSGLSDDGPTNLRQIEVALCKLNVIKNDVHAHEPSITALNRTVRSTEEVDPMTSKMVDEINHKWATLVRAIDEIAFTLDKSKDESERVGDDLERWLAWTDDMIAGLEPRRPLAGVPETAKEQMDEFLVTKAEMEQTRPEIESYLRKTGDYLNEHTEGASEQSWIGRNHAKLEGKWNKIKDLANIRMRKLQVAADRAQQLDGELVDLRGWLESAEKGLNEAGPISRLLEGLEKQRADQEERMEEIERRKAQFVDTKSLAGQIRASCEAKDAIYVKNQTVTLESKLNKFIARALERGKQLDAAKHESDTWLDGVEALEEWMDGVKRQTDVTPPTTSDVDRLRGTLESAKALVATVSDRRPHFETTHRRGVALMEHAPKNERKEIEKRNEEMKKRWDGIQTAVDGRCREAERAVIEGGKFSEAIGDLEKWMDDELEDANRRKQKGTKGDVDTVNELLAIEAKAAADRKKKAEHIAAITKKARSLVADGVDEAAEIEAATERIEKKWNDMEEEAFDRQRALSQSLEDAQQFDAKVHGLLDWLAEVEGRLKVVPAMDLPQSIAAAAGVLAALTAEKPRLEGVLSACDELLDGCHSDAEPPLKEWKRILAARWKEVEERAATKEETARDEEEKQRQREAALHDMNEFIENKRLELDEALMLPPPSSVEEADERLKAHEEFEKALREKQADLDALTKGRKRDGERDKRSDALGDKWRRLWGDSIGHLSQLEKDKAEQEELRRLQGWKFDDWRDRYVEWNDHGKARVNDLFRRLDRSSTGTVPRGAFIEAIIATKFPTSRLEMAKVADVFDKGDGTINAKEFINALKIGNRKRSTVPKTEEEQKVMIKNEMTRRRDQCCCAHKFRIDHEEDPPGKIRPKSDGGVLQTYRFGDQQIRRMVRILHTTVMVRVGGGWEPLDEFLDKHDPCKAKDRTNTSIYSQFYDDVRPAHAADKVYSFTKLKHAREDYGSPSTSSPLAHSTPKEEVTVLKPFAQAGTPGPAKGIREKTALRSVPMFGEDRFRSQRADSQELLDSGSRPSSRASDLSDIEGQRPSRIPSLRSRKGQRYNPPTAKK